MITDVYETTVCKGYQMDEVYNDMKKELVTYENIVDLIMDEVPHKKIKLLVGEASHIPSFSHPITISKDGMNYLVIDVRRLVRQQSDNVTDFKIINRPDFDLLALRARTSCLFTKNDVGLLLNFDPLPAVMFGRWVNNAVSFKLNLSAYDQNSIISASIAYYFARFNSVLNHELLKLFIHRNTYITPDIISEIFEMDEFDSKIQNLAGFVQILKESVSNIRIEKLSVALLLASLTYGWRGNNAKETMAICLEHPPTWIACLVTAIKDKNFRHSPIAKVVKAYVRKNIDKDFISRFEQLLLLNE